MSSAKLLDSLLLNEANYSLVKKISIIWKMSLPGIFAQISSVVMQYIDASMVGSLGSVDSAAIGIVSSSIWLICSICLALNVGFSVLVAQKIGGKQLLSARNIMKIGFICCFTLSFILTISGFVISEKLPILLGGSIDIQPKASSYFCIFISALPILVLSWLAGSMLQSSGNMKLPGILNIIMCFLDVIFNFIFIFPSHHVSFGCISFVFPGLDLGVKGAALGTVVAEMIIAFLMLYFLFFKDPNLKWNFNDKFIFSFKYCKKAFKVSLPIIFDHIAMCGALVFSTYIVAPLGIIAIATHSFAITAESFCYMVGYGISSAATAIIGQCIGAKRKVLTIELAWITTYLGMFIMTLAGILMFIFSPILMGMLSPDLEIIKLGTDVLKIESFAEPLYGASIIIAGCLRGAGDTLVPSCINFFSMWFIRLPLSILLASNFGLQGVWIAMCFELCCRGMFFLIRLYRKQWLRI